MDTENIKIQIKTFFGLEEILADELKKLGGREVEVKNRAVTCVGDLGFLYKINYSCRTALKILVPILTFKAWDENRFYDKIFDFPWDSIMDSSQTFAIDATVNSERFKHSQFMTLKMKDAIVDYFKAKHRSRPDIDTKNPDIKLHLHIDRELVSISLDSSGDPLFKRGYRKAQSQAPINEVLAAGMLQLAGWDGKGNFLDPMCGSGTILIEAAMIALNLPAQIFRKKFAFQNWKNYDAELFSKIKEFRINKITEFNGKITGYDIDPLSLSIAKENIETAELEDVIEVRKQNFFESKKEHFPLLIVFNPPYNERIAISDEDFYKKIGLRPSRKIKLFNGKLECRFLQYETYEGSKRK